MSSDPIDGSGDAKVVQLHPDRTPPEAPPVPVHVAEPEPGKRLPLVPEPLRPPNLRTTVEQAAGLTAYRAAFHGLRLPYLVLMTAWYALRGAGVLTGRLSAWWGAVDLRVLESQAVAAGRGGHADAMRAHTEGKKTRKQRGNVVLGVAAAVMVVLLLTVRYLPRWGWLAAAAAAVVVLARHGKPAGKHLVKAAVVPARYAEPSQDIILDAFAGLGIPALTKAVAEGNGVDFMTPIHRDGPGWCVQIDLPKGVTAVDIIDKRDKLASGLRRPLSATWPATVPNEHPGRVELWIGFSALNKQQVGRWPLLRGGQVSLFEPVPFGGDQRIKPVSILLMFASVLIGSKPRMGKTMALRILALACALDPTARIRAWELKGTGDLSCLEPVAHEYGSGADDVTLRGCLESVRKVYAELDVRAKTIRELPKEQAPENKVTPELAARRSLGLFPEVLIIDECQEAFSDPELADEFEFKTSRIAKRGPALGIMLMLATQRPDAKSLPPSVASNMGVRFCLRVLGWRENNMVLGDGMSAAGYNAVSFAESDKGIGYLAGHADDVQVVRTYYIDAVMADKIGLRARALRQAAGTLSGYAAGQTDSETGPRFAADVLSVFGADAKLWTETIATRLREQIPGVYSTVTQDAVASQLRAAGVTVKDVRETGKPPRKGCERAAVEAAVETVDV